MISSTFSLFKVDEWGNEIYETFGWNLKAMVEYVADKPTTFCSYKIYHNIPDSNDKELVAVKPMTQIKLLEDSYA